MNSDYVFELFTLRGGWQQQKRQIVVPFGNYQGERVKSLIQIQLQCHRDTISKIKIPGIS